MSQISETRREQIVQTARLIVDELGPGHLTAEAITHEVGVSRPLLYHYFANMNDLLEAVVARYVEEFGERLEAWEESRAAQARGGVQADGWALSLVGVLRPVLVDACPLLHGSDRGAGAASYPLFLAGCADVAADHALERREPALAPCLASQDPRQALHFAFTGLAGMLRAFPEAGDEAAAALLEALWGPVGQGAGEGAPAAQQAPAAVPAPAAPEEGGRKGLFGWIFN